MCPEVFDQDIFNPVSRRISSLFHATVNHIYCGFEVKSGLGLLNQ